MKKFLAIALIAGTLVACNNDADSTTAADSTGATVDANTVSADTSVAAPMSDSAASGVTVDTSAHTHADSANH